MVAAFGEKICSEKVDSVGCMCVWVGFRIRWQTAVDVLDIRLKPSLLNEPLGLAGFRYRLYMAPSNREIKLKVKFIHSYDS